MYGLTLGASAPIFLACLTLRLDRPVFFGLRDGAARPDASHYGSNAVAHSVEQNVVVTR